MLPCHRISELCELDEAVFAFSIFSSPAACQAKAGDYHERLTLIYCYLDPALPRSYYVQQALLALLALSPSSAHCCSNVESGIAHTLADRRW